jgi:FMN-dependent NADH-azoreductase
LVVLSARGEFGFATGGVGADLNALDPALAACAHYLGVAAEDIDTIAIEYQEFKDDRYTASFKAAEQRTHDLAVTLAGVGAQAA